LRSVYNYSATESQKEFIAAGINTGFVDVYLNGIRLDDANYSIIGIGVSLNVGAFGGDEVTVIGFNTVNASAGGGVGGGESYSPTGRISIAQTTGILGIGSTANVTFTNGFPEYKLLKASASDGAWITIYTDTQSRTDDENRSIDTDPLPGSGVIAELITTDTGITTQRFTPAVIGYNDDEIISNNIYAKVVNNSGISTGITVTLTIAD
jgi:hypothetical protein